MRRLVPLAKRCAECASSFEDWSGKRMYCSGACKCRAFNARHRVARPQLSCAMCGSVFTPRELGRSPVYCRRACKLRAKYHRDPGPFRRASARWAAKNRGRMRELQAAWVRAHPEHRTAKNNARRARLLSAAGHFIPADWARVLGEWSGLCAYCGMGGFMTADHRIPLSRGGSNDITNIVPACRPCNSSKGTRTEDEYRAARIAAAARAA